jgi:hypothetical protein
MTSDNFEKPTNGEKIEIRAERKAGEQTGEANPEISCGSEESQAEPPKNVCAATCNTKRDWIDKATLALEAFGLLVIVAYTVTTIVYAVITHRQWGEMREQTRIEREAAINSERAWVGLDGSVTIDMLKIAPQLKVESHYIVKNFGHGPAFKVFAYGQFWDSPKLYQNVAKTACNGPIEFATGTVPTVPRIPNPGPMGYTLFTNQTHQEAVGSPRDPWQGAGEPDLKHFWFIGCVAYLDQFKTLHWTRFCMEPDFSLQNFNKDTALRFCALYNDAGDGEPTR